MRTVFHVSAPESLPVVAAKVVNLVGDDTLELADVRVVLDRGAVIDALVDTGDGRDALERIRGAGGTVGVCSNAIQGSDVSPSALPAGASLVSSAVGELTRLQSDGYAYIRV